MLLPLFLSIGTFLLATETITDYLVIHLEADAKVVWAEKESRVKVRSKSNPKHSRSQFRVWLRSHRTSAKNLSIRELVLGYGQTISMAGAYRVAVAEGLRGARSNWTRYERFWARINWDLPDSVLSAVWGVDRGNLRQRRDRINVGPPRFRLPVARSDPHFVRAVFNERLRSKRYHGARPH